MTREAWWAVSAIIAVLAVVGVTAWIVAGAPT